MGRVGTILILLLSPALAWGAAGPSDDQVRQAIIQQSIAQYPGNCPCPYSRAKNGSTCGKRSAYSRPGGASPLCFPADVGGAAVSAYRANLK